MSRVIRVREKYCANADDSPTLSLSLDCTLTVMSLIVIRSILQKQIRGNLTATLATQP
jgi:hypothetical protein